MINAAYIYVHEAESEATLAIALRICCAYSWSGCEARHDRQALKLRGVVILQRAEGRYVYIYRGQGFMHAAIARRSDDV